MPTTLPSNVDRGEFRFVVVDGTGAEWRSVDEEMVSVLVPAGAKPEGPGTDAALDANRPPRSRSGRIDDNDGYVPGVEA